MVALYLTLSHAAKEERMKKKCQKTSNKATNHHDQPQNLPSSVGQAPKTFVPKDIRRYPESAFNFCDSIGDSLLRSQSAPTGHSSHVHSMLLIELSFKNCEPALQSIAVFHGGFTQNVFLTLGTIPANFPLQDLQVFCLFSSLYLPTGQDLQDFARAAENLPVSQSVQNGWPGWSVYFPALQTLQMVKSSSSSLR